jgi:predicted nucleotidyltransferase
MESPASESSRAFPPIHNELRLEIARRCVERKRRELGDAMLAGAVYGSVAYGAAAEHSDVEVFVVTDESVEERDENFFDEGIQVECAIVRAQHVLESAGKVGWDWGIQADAYRHQVPIWDPGAFFEGSVQPQLRFLTKTSHARSKGRGGGASRREESS